MERPTVFASCRMPQRRRATGFVLRFVCACLGTYTAAVLLYVIVVAAGVAIMCDSSGSAMNGTPSNSSGRLRLLKACSMGALGALQPSACSVEATMLLSDCTSRVSGGSSPRLYGECTVPAPDNFVELLFDQRAFEHAAIGSIITLAKQSFDELTSPVAQSNVEMRGAIAQPTTVLETDSSVQIRLEQISANFSFPIERVEQIELQLSTPDSQSCLMDLNTAEALAMQARVLPSPPLLCWSDGLGWSHITLHRPHDTYGRMHARMHMACVYVYSASPSSRSMGTSHSATLTTCSTPRYPHARVLSLTRVLPHSRTQGAFEGSASAAGELTFSLPSRSTSTLPTGTTTLPIGTTTATVGASFTGRVHSAVRVRASGWSFSLSTAGQLGLNVSQIDISLSATPSNMSLASHALHVESSYAQDLELSSLIGVDSTPLLNEAMMPLEGRPLSESLGNATLGPIEAEMARAVRGRVSPPSTSVSWDLRPTPLTFTLTSPPSTSVSWDLRATA